jgi:type I restriction enzyme, S subunit
MSEVIPEGWEEKELSSMTNPVSEKTEFNNQYEALTSSRSGLFKQSEYFNKRVTSSDNSGYRIIAPGQFTFRAMSDDGTFKFNRSSYSFKGIVSPAYEVFEAKNCSPDFLDYILNSDEFHQQIYAKAQGGTRLALKYASLSKFKIPFPPLAEQKKIASILTSVDEVIEKTQSQIDKLQDLKKGTMNELLTKGIGHTEFKDSELGRIPKSWEVASIAEISHFVTSGSRGWSQYYSERGAIFIRIGNLTRDNINLDFEDTVRVTPPVNGEGVRTKVSLGDILISITADLGVIGVVHDGVGEAYVNQHVSLVRLKENSPVISRWAGHYLSGEVCQYQFRIKNDGGAKAGLNLPTIGSIRLAQPSIIEQEKICVILDGFDTQIHTNRIKLHQTQSLKKSLMQDLLTGKVRVSVN